MLKLGSQGIAAIYLGGQKMTKAYLGETVVFDAVGPPEPVTYTISLSVDPQGGGTASGGGTVQDGASVTVTAAAANGYTFSGWRENGAIVSTSQSYTFTAASDRSLTAVFAEVIQSYSIVTSVDPAGSGTASGGGTYTQGQSVTLQASPASGYQFVAWREGGADVSTDAAYTFTASGDRTITAVFAAITYTVTTSIDPTGSGTATGAGTYQQGASVTVTAVPGDGYKFVKWTENGQTVSESASYTFTVSGDRALTAVFEAEKTSRLPDGYTEVEYVQASTSSSYIQTTLNLNNSDFTIIFRLPTTSGFYNNVTNYVISDAGGSTSTAIIKNSSGYLQVSYYASSKFTYVPITSNSILNNFGKTFKVRINGKQVYVNDVLQSVSLPANNYASRLRIGTTSGTLMAYIKYIKSTKSGSTSTSYNFELIPCTNSSGVAGFYDIMNNKFYSATSGSFKAGPAV